MLVGIPIGLALLLKTPEADNKTVIDNTEITYEEGTKTSNESGKPADMSGYRFLEEGKTTGFVNMSMSKALECMEEGTGIIYFGYTDCEWCQRAVPVLNDVANNENVGIFYVELNDEVINNEENMEKFYELTDKWLEHEDDGTPKFMTPFVVAVKEGTIVDAHIGTVDSFKIENSDSNLDEEQYNELYRIYNLMYKKITA